MIESHLEVRVTVILIGPSDFLSSLSARPGELKES